MKVILRENISDLGQIGDVIKVSDGYARNFLIPRNLVSPAIESNVNQLNHQKKVLDKRRSLEKSKSDDLAKSIEAFTCNISKKVGENDKLFGSVSNADIAEVLEKGGFTIDRRQIVISQPIKSLGVHEVEIKVHPEVSAQLKVWVVKEN